MTNARTARTAREKAAQLRAEAARAQARRRTTIVTAVVGAVVVLVVGIVVVVRQAGHQQAVSSASAPSGTPRNVLPGGGVPSDPAVTGGGRVRVDLYEDFQCPVCREFESADGQLIKNWQKAGTIEVVYHPVAFLDRASTTDYSSRAVNAAAAVLDSAPASFQAFHDLLYANQPAEGSAGLTDDQLIAYAVQAGAPHDPVAAAVRNRTYRGWVVQQTDEFSRKYNATPTVVVEGRQVQALDPASLKAAVAKAAQAKGLKPPA